MVTPFWPARALAAWAMARRAAWAPAAALLLLSPPAAVARVAAPRPVMGASGRCQQLQDTYYSEEMWLAPGEMVYTSPKTTPVTMPQGGKYYVTGFEGACRQRRHFRFRTVWNVSLKLWLTPLVVGFGLGRQ